MPEGDTVHLAATRLRAALVGATLTRSDFRVPRFATTDLSGREILAVRARGKHIFVRVEGGVSIHTHFLMQGSWHLYRPGRRWRGPDHEVRIVLETHEWTAVGFRIPILEVIDSADEDDAVAHLGPDVLGDDWDADEVLARMTAQGERTIGDVLIDQRVLAGPGNVYRSEICFLAGVHPDTLVRDVGDLTRLIALTKRAMEANRSTGSQVTTGDPRSGRSHWVYGRGGQPCRRCRTPVSYGERETSGGTRVTYWCPACQPTSPTDADIAARTVTR